MKVDGQEVYLLEHPDGPYDVLVETVPPGYTLTYKTQWGSQPPEPDDIDDGVRDDDGAVVLSRSDVYPGIPLWIAARSFDPSGVLSPSITTWGQFWFPSGDVVIFNPPTGSEVEVGDWITVSSPGRGVAIAVGETTFPPAPTTFSGLYYGWEVFRFQYGGSVVWDPLYITAAAKHPNGSVSQPYYAVYTRKT
jgi:hypothetical protein